MKAGGQLFVNPATAAQRRYESLRAYLYDDESAETVAGRFGYTPATVRQLASELRAGRLELFVDTRPGPKGPRKQPKIRQRVLELRARDLSITQIANILTREGSPVSHDTVWQVLQAEGLERLAVRGAGRPHRPRRHGHPRSRSNRSMSGRPGCGSPPNMPGCICCCQH